MLIRKSCLLWTLLCLSVTGEARSEPVATRMRNVVFHLGNGIELRVADLVGQLVSRTPPKPPVFDDLDSYVLDLQAARVSMTPESLTSLMNNYVFAYPDAPFKNLKITIENGELRQTGALKKGVDIPFSMRATIGVTPEGRIRIHPTAIKAAGFIPKGVLNFFGLELERLVKLKRTPAVTLDGDDLLLDPEHLLPPPRIHGRLTRAFIENGLIVEQFGSAGKSPATVPPYHQASNYLYFRGGTLRFGKLTMEDTDLMLVDMDSKDAFEFSPEKYNDQLVAGYSKNTRSHGLIVFMPDLNDLRRPGK